MNDLVSTKYLIWDIDFYFELILQQNQETS